MKNEPAVPSYDSMTLRDYFAAKALEGYLAAHAGPDVQMPGVNHTAAMAYGYADAMLAERDKK